MYRCLSRDRTAARYRSARTRSALEAASIAWWLLEPGLWARQRVCRMYLLRRNSAAELARSIDEVGEDHRVAREETVSRIEQLCDELGLAPFVTKGRTEGAELEREIRAQVSPHASGQFSDAIGFKGGYSIYSWSSPSEPRGFGVSSGGPRHDCGLGASRSTCPYANPEAILQGQLVAPYKSMVGPATRVSQLFGWPTPGLGKEVDDTIDHIERAAIARLQP